MVSASEPDKETLEQELDQIKETLGIQERYPGGARTWLMFGALVGVASLLSQVVYLERLPGYWYGVIWMGLMSLGMAVQVRTNRSRSEWSGTDKPSWVFLFGTMLVTALALLAALSPVLAELSYEDANLYIGLIFMMLIGGSSYLLVGNTLKAYYIRRIDRYAFYIGGNWILLLGMLTPHIPFLRTWFYSVYGVVYVAYTLCVYMILTDTLGVYTTLTEDLA